MLKENNTYSFVKDFEQAKEIFKGIFFLKINRISDFKEVDGKYSAYVEILSYYERPMRRTESEVVGKDYYRLENDYEILCNGKYDEFATDILRQNQTKAIGKSYVDGLEEYLNN